MEILVLQWPAGWPRQTPGKADVDCSSGWPWEARQEPRVPSQLWTDPQASDRERGSGGLALPKANQVLATACDRGSGINRLIPTSPCCSQRSPRRAGTSTLFRSRAALQLISCGGS